MKLELEKRTTLRGQVDFWVKAITNDRLPDWSGPFNSYEEAEAEYNKIKANRVTPGTEVIKSEII